MKPKKKIEKYEELWIKIRYLNRSITKNFFRECDKYYPQVFLDECLYKF